MLRKEYKIDVLKEVLGGNYIALIREPAIQGLILDERGKTPKLTERGEKEAERLAMCWELWERERA